MWSLASTPTNARAPSPFAPGPPLHTLRHHTSIARQPPTAPASPPALSFDPAADWAAIVALLYLTQIRAAPDPRRGIAGNDTRAISTETPMISPAAVPQSVRGPGTVQHLPAGCARVRTDSCGCFPHRDRRRVPEAWVGEWCRRRMSDNCTPGVAGSHKTMIRRAAKYCIVNRGLLWTMYWNRHGGHP